MSNSLTVVIPSKALSFDLSQIQNEIVVPSKEFAFQSSGYLLGVISLSIPGRSIGVNGYALSLDIPGKTVESSVQIHGQAELDFLKPLATLASDIVVDIVSSQSFSIHRKEIRVSLDVSPCINQFNVGVSKKSLIFSLLKSSTGLSSVDIWGRTFDINGIVDCAISPVNLQRSAKIWMVSRYRG